jgi:arylsulfatase B/arylsulfatase I/J
MDAHAARRPPASHHHHHQHEQQHRCRAPRPATAAAASSAPAVQHILHIVADDLGYDDVGYHHAAIHSPHLDELRLCGVHLDHFYAFKACAPSRASLLSGRYPFSMGVYENADIDTNGTPTNFTFLPEILRRAGFATHAVGKY